MFMCAIAHWSASVGEVFHAVSPAAITLRGYAEAMAAWFGREPKLRYLPWVEWKDGQNELEAAQTHDHIAHSPNCSIAKAERMLGYRPRYRSIEGGVRIGELVDGEGDRSGRTQSGLTPDRRPRRGIAAARTRRMGRRQWQLADIRRQSGVGSN
jgi:hypothetical protein